MLSKTTATRIILLLLAASLLMGLGRIATLPPFEGFDETAHYSRLEAEAFATPGTATRFITKDVEGYYTHGPMSPRWIFARAYNDAYHDALKNNAPPRLKEYFGKETRYTDYHKFFADDKRVAEYGKPYRQQPAYNALNRNNTVN